MALFAHYPLSADENIANWGWTVVAEHESAEHLGRRFHGQAGMRFIEDHEIGSLADVQTA